MNSSLVPTSHVEALRSELADLAFILEHRGHRDAADVAMTIAARLKELCDAAATRLKSSDRSGR